MGTREHSGEFICVDGHVTVDQHPFVKAVVIGSKHITRDLSESREAEELHDPHGDRALTIEIRRGGMRNIKMCSNPRHLGDAWLHVSEFSTDGDAPDKRDYWCKKCRSDAAFLRRAREAEAQGRSLREKAGRPRK